MVTWRALLFTVLLYVSLIVVMILILPTLVMPRRALLWVLHTYMHFSVVLQEAVVGTRSTFHFDAPLPEGGYIIAAKHQSMWETFALFDVFPDPAIVYKRQLQWIPLFGWYLMKAGMITVDRGAGSSAIEQVVTGGRREIAKGRQLMIFPEGTRRAPGAPPAYRFGVARLYDALQCPVVPVAVNSGLYWPRRSFARHPGTVEARVLPAIAPGLTPEQLLEKLEDVLEAASDQLLIDAIKRDNMPLPESAQTRMAQLQAVAGE